MSFRFCSSVFKNPSLLLLNSTFVFNVDVNPVPTFSVYGVHYVLNNLDVNEACPSSDISQFI